MHIFHFSRAFFFMGFTTRFIIAVAILSYLYSQNKHDANLKKGLYALLIIGGLILSLLIFALLAFIFFGGFATIFFRAMGDIPHIF